MDNLHDVSGWIDAFVEAGTSFGATATLRECMDHGDRDGEVRVRNESGEHRHGEAVYEDAFLAALRELLASGTVEPVFASEEQRSAWSRWMGGAPCDPGTRSPILDIALRSVERCGPEEDSRTSAQRAGEHLLALLKTESSVRYSRFYDGSDETEARLRAEFGLEEGDSAAILMDDAVWDLRQAGLVRTRELPELLADGWHDYAIERTDEGRRFLESGKALTFRDVIR